MAVGYAIAELSRSGGGTVNVRTETYHPFVVGDKIRLYNVLGGGAYPYMAGNPYTITAISGPPPLSGPGTTTYSVYNRFRYVQSGVPGTAASDSMSTSIAISSGTPVANSNQLVQIVTATPHNLTRSPRIQIRGVTGISTAVGFLNGNRDPEDVTIVNSTTLNIRIRRFQSWLVNGTAPSFANATLEWIPSGAVVALDDGINPLVGNIGDIGISTGQNRFFARRSEGQVIAGVVNLAAQSKGIDYAFLRLFDPTDASKISTAPTKTILNIRTAATTLRSALDTVIESYQGTDAKRRRYFINPDGQLVYEILDDTQPATANAPYKIVTSSIGSPNLSSAAATVNPYDLSIEWDQDTTKRALFTTSSRTGSPIADLVKSDSPDALGTAYARAGAPYFDEAVDYPANTDDRLITRQQAAKSFFLERHAPILSGKFSLRGAGTASWNDLGFSSGYALITSPATAVFSPGLEVKFPVSASGGTVTVSTQPYQFPIYAGMSVVIAGVYGLASVPGTVTVLGTATRSFTYIGAGTGQGTALGDVTYTATAAFIRTGTAPNQIVTAYFPRPHGITSGATTIVSGLTSTAGSTMNGTVVATVTSDYEFTYPSAGTNGTATGTPTVTSLSLIPRWTPGMYADISAPALSLNGLYRVEQVDWRLERGSYVQAIDITFNRRPMKTLTKLLAEKD